MAPRPILPKVAWLLLLLALAGCDSVGTTTTASQTTPTTVVRSAIASPTAAAPPATSPPPIPQVISPSIMLTTNGFRIEGTPTDSRWIDDSHLLIKLASYQYFLADGNRVYQALPDTASYYLADLTSVSLYPLPITETLTVFGNAWLTKDAAIVKVCGLGGKYDKFDYTPPCKLSLINLHTGSMQTLADQGEVAAALPDGDLLIRRGWVDAPIELLAPPYTSSPSPVTPGGLWTEKWFVSPDSDWVAWFEMEFSKDYEKILGKDYLPTWLPSAEPPPLVKSLVFWNRSSGEVRRFPAADAKWPGIGLLWNKDSHSVIYSEHKSGRQEEMSLVQMSLDGQKTSLVSYACDSFIEANAVGPDGSLYFTVDLKMRSPHNACEESRRLIHRSSDGKLETVLRDQHLTYYGPLTDKIVVSRYTRETQTTLVITLLDMKTGNIRDTKVTALPGPISPQGSWFLQGFEDGALLIVPIK